MTESKGGEFAVLEDSSNEHSRIVVWGTPLTFSFYPAKGSQMWGICEAINKAHAAAVQRAVKEAEHRLYEWAAREVNSKVKEAVEGCARIAGNPNLTTQVGPAQAATVEGRQYLEGQWAMQRRIVDEILTQGATHG